MSTKIQFGYVEHATGLYLSSSKNKAVADQALQNDRGHDIPLEAVFLYSCNAIYNVTIACDIEM